MNNSAEKECDTERAMLRTSMRQESGGLESRLPGTHHLSRNESDKVMTFS